MEKIHLFLSLTCFVVLTIAIKAESQNVDVTTQIPCPNSPIQPTYPIQQYTDVLPQTTQICPNSPIQPTYPIQQYTAVLPQTTQLCHNSPIQPTYPIQQSTTVLLQTTQLCPSSSPCLNPPTSSANLQCSTNYQIFLPSSSPLPTPCSINCTNSISTKPKPHEIRECPPGSILINGVCRLLYCGEQSISREGKCFKIECPEGTYWTGSRCEMKLDPVVHTITFKTTMMTHINSSSSPITLNNENNVTVSTPSTVNTPSSTPSNPPKCCTVVTPRICKPKINGNIKKWDCYSKRYRRCGDICVAPTVYLKPPYPSSSDKMFVLPPENFLKDCRRAKTCVNSNDMYDCSGCVEERPENCSSYCYRYVCPGRQCKYYNQQDFCNQYPGQQGCAEDDGCFDDWCGGNK